MRHNPPYRHGNLFIAGRRDGLLSEAILRYKYHAERDLAAPLAELLAASIDLPSPATCPDASSPDSATTCASTAVDLPNPVIVIPLPTVPKHIRARGFDHTMLLARALCSLKNWRLSPVLLRKNNTVQVGADNETRVLQAASAYELSPDFQLDPAATYLLLDDITTTGASLAAAEKTLRDAGAKKICQAVLAESSIQDDFTDQARSSLPPSPMSG